MEPARATTAELVTDWIQQRLLTERPSGFIPYLDSVYGGGGFTLGAGYRRAFADRSLWMVRGLYSSSSTSRSSSTWSRASTRSSA